MKKILYSLFFVLISVGFFACKKDIKGDENIEPPITAPKKYSTKDVQIILPPNSKLDLATSTIFSLNIESKIDNGGKAKAAYNTGLPNIAYVFDKDNNVVLAGFLTDATNTISVGSTAEVLLYFSMGTFYQPYEVMEKFIAGIRNAPGVSELKTELENLFVAEHTMLQKGSFATVLKTKTAAIISTGQIPGRYGRGEELYTKTYKPANITVDANDVRSGLRLAENGFSKFTITNTFRRRAHAFIYKMSYKDLQGNPHTVNTKVSGTMKADADIKVGPTGAVRDFKGVLQDWAAGKGMEFAEIVAGPVEIPLEDNETEATYTVRVVGPGTKRSIDITEDEQKKLRSINLETAAFDFIIPFMLDVVGHKDVLEKLKLNTVTNIGSGKLQKLLEATSDIINAIPKANDALESGDYKVVMEEFIYAFVNGRMATVSNEWIEFLFDYIEDTYAKHMQNGGKEYFSEYAGEMNKKVTKVLKVMEVIDIGMKVIDYGRLTKHILGSRTIEDWELTAKEIEVNLDPKAFTLGPLEQRKLTAYIKTTLGSDDLIEYEWETSGKYGYLWDERGHKGKSFTSSIKEAFYLCDALSSDLGTGTHVDTIRVTTYLKKGQTRTKIGTSISIATITKDEVFTVPFTYNVSINAITDQYTGKVSYNASNPTANAEFSHRTDAKSYSIRRIINGVKQTASIYYPKPQETIIKSGFYFGNYFNTNCEQTGLYAKNGMSDAEMQKEKARQEEIITCYKAKNVTGIEVTVSY